MNFDFEIFSAVTWILVANYGNGFLALKLLSPRAFDGVAFSVLFGTSLFVIIGGWLALFGFFSSAFVNLWLLSGSLLTIWSFNSKRVWKKLLTKRRIPDWLGLIPFLVGFGAAVFVFVRNSGYGWINGHDDMEAYMAFAQKLHQTGSLGADPFSFRRLVSSLGGQTILDGAFLGLAPAYGIKAVDMSLGFAAFIMVVAHLTKKSWVRRIGGSLFVLAVSFYWIPIGNTTSHYLSMAIILSLTIFISEYDRSWSWRDWIVVAVFFGVGLTLKNTNAAFLILVSLILLYLGLRSVGSSVLKNLTLFVSITFGIATPFAVSLFISSGTFFYPFLGGGFEAVPITRDVLDTAKLWPLLIEFSKVPFRRPEMLLAGVVALVSFLSHRGERDGRLLAVQIVAGLSLLVPYLSSSGSFDATRYAGTLFFPLLLASLLGLRGSVALKGTVSIATISVISLMSSSIYLSLDPRLPFQVTLEPTPSWLSKQEYLSEKARVRGIQNLLPDGATVLVNGPSTYLWDYEQNEILIGDIPGSASPPPGINLWGTTKEIAEYLAETGVDFAVTDYRGHFEYETHRHMLEPTYPPQWRRQIVNQFRFYEAILEIQSECGEIFDDGKSVVVAIQCPLGADN